MDSWVLEKLRFTGFRVLENADKLIQITFRSGHFFEAIRADVCASDIF